MGAVIRRTPREVAGPPGRGGGRRRRLGGRHSGRGPWRQGRPSTPTASTAASGPRSAPASPSGSTGGQRRSPSSTPTASTPPWSSSASSPRSSAGRADYVAGSRFAGMPRRMLPHRWVGNRVLTIGVRVLVRRWGVRDLTDAQSGYRALSWRAAAAAEIVHDFNYAQVLTLDLLAKGFRYAEVPDQLRVPPARAVVRPPRSLPAPGPARRPARAGLVPDPVRPPRHAFPSMTGAAPDVVTCAAASARTRRELA